MKKRKQIVVFLALSLMLFAFKLAHNDYKAIDSMSSLMTYHNIAGVTGKDFVSQNSELAKSGFALWKEEKNQEVKDPVSDRSSKIALVSYTGDSRLILPIPQRLEANDYLGCLIDQETATTLFGSANAKGGKILIKGAEFEIRNVFSSPSRTVIIAAEQNVSLDILTVKSTEGKSLSFPCELLVKFAMYKNFVKILGCISVVFVVCCLISLILKKRKKIEKFPAKKLVCEITILILVFGCILASLYILPKEFLPNRWSDFGHWRSLASDFKAFSVDYFSLGKTRQISFVMNLISKIITAFLVFLISANVIKEQLKERPS